MMKIIQDYFFKQRIIFCCSHIKNIPIVLQSIFEYKLIEQKVILSDPQVNILLPKAINFKQLESESLFALVCYEKSTSSVAGVGFLLVPRSNPIWYDNVILRLGEARLIGDYAYPKYRGKGIGSFLNGERIRFAINDLGVRYTTVIVESYRKPALKAQSKFSKKCGFNILIKFYKHNIFSICLGCPYRGIWYVGPGRKRRWHVL
jgi:GNAT superfamily N-acetyltransferase